MNLTYRSQHSVRVFVDYVLDALLWCREVGLASTVLRWYRYYRIIGFSVCTVRRGVTPVGTTRPRRVTHFATHRPLTPLRLDSTRPAPQTADRRPPTATTPQCRCALLPSVASLKPTAPCHLCSLRSPQVPASLRSRAFSLPDVTVSTRYCPYAPLFVQFLRVTSQLAPPERAKTEAKKGALEPNVLSGLSGSIQGERWYAPLGVCPRSFVGRFKFLSDYVVIGYQINIRRPLK